MKEDGINPRSITPFPLCGPEIPHLSCDPDLSLTPDRQEDIIRLKARAAASNAAANASSSTQSTRTMTRTKDTQQAAQKKSTENQNSQGSRPKFDLRKTDYKKVRFVPDDSNPSQASGRTVHTVYYNKKGSKQLNRGPAQKVKAEPSKSKTRYSASLPRIITDHSSKPLIRVQSLPLLSPVHDLNVKSGRTSSDSVDEIDRDMFTKPELNGTYRLCRELHALKEAKGPTIKDLFSSCRMLGIALRGKASAKTTIPANTHIYSNLLSLHVSDADIPQIPHDAGRIAEISLPPPRPKDPVPILSQLSKPISRQAVPFKWMLEMPPVPLCTYTATAEDLFSFTSMILYPERNVH